MSSKTPIDSAETFEPESFEHAMHELESLVERMDSPDVGLEALLGDYKRGAQLVKYCRDRLQKVQSEVEQLDDELSETDKE